MEHRKKPRRIRGGQLVIVHVALYIALLYARQVPVKRLVKVFAAAVAQGQPHSERHHALAARPVSQLQYPTDVLLGIVDERQKRRQPHHRRDTAFTQLAQHLKSPGGRADVRLYYAAQVVVKGGQGHLNHRFRIAVDLLQQVDVPQNHI